MVLGMTGGCGDIGWCVVMVMMLTGGCGSGSGDGAGDDVDGCGNGNVRVVRASCGNGDCGSYGLW